MVSGGFSRGCNFKLWYLVVFMVSSGCSGKSDKI